MQCANPFKVYFTLNLQARGPPTGLHKAELWIQVFLKIGAAPDPEKLKGHCGTVGTHNRIVLLPYEKLDSLTRIFPLLLPAPPSPRSSPESLQWFLALSTRYITEQSSPRQAPGSQAAMYRLLRPRQAPILLNAHRACHSRPDVN